MVNVLKRLQDLEKLIRFQAPRIITIVVAEKTDDPKAYDVALKEILDAVQPQPDDLVVYVNQWGPCVGLPRLCSVTY